MSLRTAALFYGLEAVPAIAVMWRHLSINGDFIFPINVIQPGKQAYMVSWTRNDISSRNFEFESSCCVQSEMQDVCFRCFPAILWPLLSPGGGPSRAPLNDELLLQQQNFDSFVDPPSPSVGINL